MSFETKGDSIIGTHSLEDLKLVYRVLHRYLADHVELMDTEFLLDLQNYLQERARAEGIDTSHHGAWDVWLGNTDGPDCATCVKRRFRIEIADENK